jgi:hypothetical protein
MACHAWILINLVLNSGRRKPWDDEYVLKRKFSALIPAFDPRPGRTNVNQTTDLEVPPPGEDSASADSKSSPGIWNSFKHFWLVYILWCLNKLVYR